METSTADNAQHTFNGVRITAAQLALGSWLAWFWLAFGEGWCNPLEGKGYLVVGAPTALLAAAAAFFLCAWKHRKFDQLATRHSLTLVAGIVWTVCSLPLSLSAVAPLPYEITWALSLVGAPCAAWLLMLCGRAYATESVTHAFSRFLVAWLFTFFLYFLATSLSGLGGMFVFSLLPCTSALLAIAPARQASAKANRPDEVDGADAASNHPDETSALEPKEARMHFVEMVMGLAVFFFAIGFVRSTGLGQATGPENFHLGAAAATALMAICALAGIALSLRGGPSLKFIRTWYAFASLGLSFATMTMALTGIDNESVRTITDLAYLALLPVIWCAMAATARLHRRSVGFSFGLTLGTIAASSALGWVVQNLVAFVYGNQNAYTTILLSLGFLCFAYFMFGFPITSYSSYLMSKADLPADIETLYQPNRSTISFREAASLVADAAKLSKREHEVFFLLVKGWSNERIAEDLVVSYHTVRAHVRNIYTKLEVHNRQEILKKIEDVRMSPQEENPPQN